MKKKAIFCVDDEEVVLVAIKDQLRREFSDEFRIETAGSGTEALSLFEFLLKKDIEVPVLIADHLMPGMKGDDLIIRIHELSPGTIKILLTGQASGDAVGNIVNHARLFRYISKPWEAGDLLLTVREALKTFAREQQLKSIQAMTKRINGFLNPADLIRYVLSEALRLTDTSSGLICLIDGKNGKLEMKDSLGTASESNGGLMDTAIKAFASSGAVMSENAAVSPGPGSCLAIPFMGREKIIGVLSLENPEGKKSLSSNEREVLEVLLSEAAIAIENSVFIEARIESEAKLENLVKKLKQELDAVIEVISLTLEKKDPFTSGHQHRVANLARSIAEEMGLSEDLVDAIRVSGFIHDLGKIGIPTEILSKPGILNDAERTIIRDHSQIGYEILQKIDFPWPIAEIVYQHHERLDGSGYPRRLRQNAIMLEARILACADVIEAIASHRPYRPALGVEAALDEIVRGKGVQFDASVVEACLRLFHERGYALKSEKSGRREPD